MHQIAHQGSPQVQGEKGHGGNSVSPSEKWLASPLPHTRETCGCVPAKLTGHPDPWISTAHNLRECFSTKQVSFINTVSIYNVNSSWFNSRCLGNANGLKCQLSSYNKVEEQSSQYHIMNGWEEEYSMCKKSREKHRLGILEFNKKYF